MKAFNELKLKGLDESGIEDREIKDKETEEREIKDKEPIVSKPKESDSPITADGTYSIIGQDIIVMEGIHATIFAHQGISNIILGKGSDVNIIMFKNPLKQKIELKDGAKCIYVALFENDSVQEFSIRKNSDLTVSNIYNISGKEINSKTSVYHLAPNSKSLMHSRAVISKGKLCVKGLIDISEDASGADGYQKTEVILLDQGSEAISIPELSIKNNDVRCSHGASISSLDQDKMFYIQSRGLTSEESAKLMIEGFFADILKKLPEDISNMIMEHI